MFLKTKDDLRNSGLFTAGSTSMLAIERSYKNRKIGRSFLILPDEVWGLKKISGTIDEAGRYLIQVGVDPANIVFSTIFNNYNKGCNFCYKDKDFLGHLIGPTTQGREIFVFISLLGDAGYPFNCSAVALFERLYPVSLWTQAPQAAAPATQLVTAPVDVFGGPTAKVTPAGVPDVRMSRDVYAIEDPLAIESEEPGCHQLANGTWHRCPRCIEILTVGDLSGGLEILQGGEVNKKLEKDVEVMVNESTTQTLPEVEVTTFRGGTKATYEQLQKIKMETAKAPSQIECRSCGAVGGEKAPPVCKNSCPIKVNNDIIFSSWHKAPNGSYHSCPTCVNMNWEKIGK